MYISVLTNNAYGVKREKVENKNTLVHTLGTPNLGLKDYAILYAAIYCQIGDQDNAMHNPVVIIILTQYHISKVLNVLGGSGVTEVLKDLK